PARFRAADLERPESLGGPRSIQGHRDGIPLRGYDEDIEIGKVVRGTVRVVDRLDPRGSPTACCEKPLQIPLAYGIGIHAGPGLPREPVRRQADQDLRGASLARGAEERLAALVEEVQRPPE